MAPVKDADAQREYEIETEYQAMLDDYSAGNCQQARWHLEKMRELIGGRSVDQVERMECARGLS